MSQFIIQHVINHDYEDEAYFKGPFYTRREAAHYLADPTNNIVEYLPPDEHSREPYVQTADKGSAQWVNTTRKQLIQIAIRKKEGFSYTGYGDFIRIIELKK